MIMKWSIHDIIHHQNSQSFIAQRVDFSVCKLEKNRRFEYSREECRLSQENPAAFQMYETTSVKGIHGRRTDLSNFGSK